MQKNSVLLTSLQKKTTNDITLRSFNFYKQ